MNLGLSRAKGELICRMDAHADYASDYVEASVRVLRRTGAWNVGGAARPRDQGGFQAVVCAALGSVLGFGGSAYRDPSREGFVESVFNGTFRREVFDRVGPYDPEAVTNEDAELNQRILGAGGGIYLSREIVVHYYPRETLRGLGRQYFAYGRGRARTLLKHGRLPSWRPVVPFLGVVGLGGMSSLALVSVQARSVVTLALSLYLGLLLGEALRLGGRRGLGFSLQVARALGLMHLAHGLGFGRGLFQFGLRGRGALLGPRVGPGARAEGP
jgi:hypothetical protein